MCGICGKLQFDEQEVVSPVLIERMMQSISYRGPDGRGHHARGPVGLGHTRLAIIDLSSGAQPLSNEDDTVWLVYNGEIYNFKELRGSLLQQGHQFKTASDTEVIVHLYEQYGVECLSRLRGMFAFALWDAKRRVLLLARDRLGIKPLYYADTGKALVFASEIKALLADPDVRCQVDPQSVDNFLTHFCLPGGRTLWKGVHKLEPGFFLVASSGQVAVERYWDLDFRPRRKWKSIDEAADAVYQLIKRTVEEHMISDVPVGFLSSGGVDSTVVLSCAASQTNKRISTFTVGFDDAGFADERPYARLVSQRFGTEHHEITFTAKEFWEFLPSLVWHMEEPVCDPPAVSLHYVSKLARQHVKVLLSGEGGDEAFGGYYTYRKYLLLEKAKAAISPFGSLFSAGLTAAAHWAPLRKVGRLAPFLHTGLQDYYYSRVSSPFTFFNANKKVLYSNDFLDTISCERSLDVTRTLFQRIRHAPLLHQMQYIDTKTSLPDDLLIKADRITMGNSLELRVPFLDHLLLEFAASLPPDFKVKFLATKRILRKAFKNRIPTEILKRKKAGFPIPVERWLRRELRQNVQDILLSPSSLNRGYFKRKGVEKLLDLSDQGHPLSKEIFSLLTLELLHLQFLHN